MGVPVLSMKCSAKVDFVAVSTENPDLSLQYSVSSIGFTGRLREPDELTT